MVNKQSLRINNWVLTKTAYDKPTEIQVHSIAANGINETPDNPKGIPFDDLEGIALTEKHLLAWGFVKWADDTFRKQIDEYIVFHLESDGRYGFWSDSLENECNFTLVSQDNRIKHLHQLQNLFYDLTDTELS